MIRRYLICSIALLLVLLSGQSMLRAQTEPKGQSAQERALIELSDRKWGWMASKDVVSLRSLFHERAMFVHMGGTWGKEQELETIEKGLIWYKHAAIRSREVKRAGSTAIIYSSLRMTSVVGGREVSFPFMVSEVYVQERGQWLLLSLIFTRTTEDEPADSNK